jgi:hypothetical protein
VLILCPTEHSKKSAGSLASCPQTRLGSMGGCMTSALTDWSAVEVVGAVLGTVSSRTRRGLGAVATG